MKLAKKLAFFSTIVTLMSLFSVFVSAQFSTAFKPFFDLMKYIMEDLAREAIFRRFMIWMLLFTLLTLLVRRVLKEETERKRGNIIALILSLIMVLGIPQSAINIIFDEYSLFAFLAMYLVIPILLFAATKDMNNPKLRGICFIVLGLLLGIGATAVSKGAWAASFKDFVAWLYVGSSVCVVAGIIMLFSGGGGDTGCGGGWGGWNPFYKAMQTPRSAAPTAPTFPPSPPRSRRAALDPLINAVHAAVLTVHNTYENQLIPAGTSNLTDNYDAHHGGTRNPSLNANYLTIYNTLVNTDVRNAINAISAVYAHPNRAYISPAQLADLTRYQADLTAIVRNITTYNTNYIRRLSKNQKP